MISRKEMNTMVDELKSISWQRMIMGLNRTKSHAINKHSLCLIHLFLFCLLPTK
jgi:hypothetical protein